MNKVKIVFTEEDKWGDHEDGPPIVAKDIVELTAAEAKDLANRLDVQAKKTSYDHTCAIREAAERLSKTAFKKVLRELGYAPNTEVAKAKMITPEQKLWYYHCGAQAWNPVNPTNRGVYDYNDAVKKMAGPNCALFAKVELDDKHPFMKDVAKLKKQQTAKKVAANEKRRQRVIEKAKKVLEEAGEGTK